MTELRFAVRRLLARPGFLAATTATLSLGIGATALMFSAVFGLLIRPLPFADADRLAWVMARPAEQADSLDTVSSDEVRTIADLPALESVAVIGDMGLVREIGTRHDRWRGIWATRGLAGVLGIQLVAGRLPDSIDPDGPRPMLMAHGRWQSDFAGDPAVIGRVVEFADNKRFIVAGVLPDGLEFPFARAPHRGNGAGFVAGVQDFWVVQSDESAHLPGGLAITRVRAERSPSDAAAQVSAQSSAPGRPLVFVPLREQVLGGLGPALRLMQGFALLVLLIACGNLGTLMLARGVAQRSEIAVRVALGASRGALARLFAAEASVICACGALGGLLLAAGGRSLLPLLAPRHQALVQRVAVDWTVALAIAALAGLITILVGVVPGLLRARGAASSGIESGGRHTAGDARRSLRALAVIQVSLSLVLLTGAIALKDSFQRIMHVDAGYDMSGVVAADMLLYIPGKEAVGVIDQMVNRLQALPGVEAVGMIQSTPLTGKWTFSDSMTVLDGRRQGPTPPVSGAFVGFDYFRAMGIPLLAGRTFTKSEFTNSRQRVMIINDVAATSFFPGINAVGARLQMNGSTHQVIGVVKGTRDVRLDTAAESQWYQPAVMGSSQVIVRSQGPTSATVDSVRTVLRGTDPRVIIERVDALETIASDSVIERRIAAQLVSAFAATAVVLAALGLYGVVHFGSVRRQREFGIRLAIGASRQTILRMVVAQGLLIAVTGAILGVGISLASARAMEALLFEARAATPATLLMAAAAMLVVAIAASLWPAWKAATTDPMRALTTDQ